MSKAQKYQGLSVQELFAKAVKQFSMIPRRVLIAAIFNIKSTQWMFVYTEKLGHRQRIRKDKG